MANNTESAAIAAAYGNPQDDPNIATKLIAYITFHLAHVQKSLKTIDADWHSG